LKNVFEKEMNFSVEKFWQSFEKLLSSPLLLLLNEFLGSTLQGQAYQSITVDSILVPSFQGY